MPSPAKDTATSKLTFETTHWPLVVLTLHDQLTDDEYKAMFAQWEAVFARREKFAALTDARRIKERAPPKQRELIAAWTRSVEPRVIQYSVAHITVIESAWVRGAMTAIEWLHKPKVPVAYHTNLRDACDFAMERLKQAGVPITDQLRAYRAKL